MPANNRIRDKVIQNQIDLMRFSNKLSRDVTELLSDMQMELLVKIQNFDIEGVSRQAFKMRRAEALIEEANTAIDQSYRATNKLIVPELVSLAEVQTTAATRFLNDIFQVEKVTTTFSRRQLRTLVKSDTFILGQPLKDWWKRQSRETRFRFAQAIRQGVLQGENNQELVIRAIGKSTGRKRRVKINGRTRVLSERRGGILDVSKRNAETAVRTSAQTISNDIQMQTYKDNQDVIKAMQAQATLDTRTSKICIARSGAVWNISTGKPLPESPIQESFPGPPPWHPNCRTVLIPVTKSWDEMFQDAGGRAPQGLGDIPKSTQESLDGQVPEDVTFEAWLSDQSVGRQKEVLGKGRFDLWRKDKISLTQLIDQKGRIRTVEELRKKYG